MKYILTVACFFLRSTWQAVSLRSALTMLWLVPLAAQIMSANSPLAAEPSTGNAKTDISRKYIIHAIIGEIKGIMQEDKTGRKGYGIKACVVA